MVGDIMVVGPRQAVDTDYWTVVNTTSRSCDFGRSLSPFLLGPAPLYDEMFSKTMENAWQYAKVYPEFANENDDPTEDYWTWAHAGWSSKLDPMEVLAAVFALIRNSEAI
jgi:hypothetical protein